MIRGSASRFLVCVTLVLTACSSSSSPAIPTTVPVSSTLPTSSGGGDGELRIGLLVPRPILDDFQVAALTRVLESVVRIINSNGGFGERPVVLLVEDETESADATVRAIENLLEKNVDAIIGPSSSRMVVETASKITDSGVGLCSPAAKSILLDNLPDGGLMIRTSRLDTTFSEAIARQVADEGVAAATVIFPDDPYGRAFDEDLRQRLVEQGLDETSSDQGSDDSSPDSAVDFSHVAYRLSDGTFETDVDLGDTFTNIVFIGDESATKAFIEAAAALQPGFGSKNLFVTDSMTSVSNNDLSRVGLEDSGLSIRGVADDAFAGAGLLTDFIRNLDPDDGDVSADGIPWISAFADCLNVIALAAVQAGSDDATEFMKFTTDITNTGSGCDSFVDCLGYIREPRNIDYNGPTGELDLDARGDAVNGTILTYRLTSGGLLQVTGRLRVDVQD